MTTAAEAHAAASAAVGYGKPVWVAWTLDDQTGALRGGESIGQALSQLDDLPVEAVLFNCCSAQDASFGLRALAERRAGQAMGAYANPFHREPPEDQQTSSNPDWLDADAYAGIARTWLTLGATIVGGCCGTDPDYIRTLSNTLRKA